MAKPHARRIRPPFAHARNARIKPAMPFFSRHGANVPRHKDLSSFPNTSDSGLSGIKPADSAGRPILIDFATRIVDAYAGRENSAHWLADADQVEIASAAEPDHEEIRKNRSSSLSFPVIALQVIPRRAPRSGMRRLTRHACRRRTPDVDSIAQGARLSTAR